MRVKLHGVRRISINSGYIKLDALLKHAALVSTGGEAKALIQGGHVFVDGEICVQRGRKITHGSVVKLNGETLIVELG